MKLNNDLLKLLGKTYEPSAVLNMKFRGNDLSFKTDANGNPILLFIGKRNEQGNITGERFLRTLKYDKHGAVIKDHWDLKGPAT